MCKPQESWEKASHSKSFSTSSTSTDNNIISALETKKESQGKVDLVKLTMKSIKHFYFILAVEIYFFTSHCNALNCKIAKAFIVHEKLFVARRRLLS